MNKNKLFSNLVGRTLLVISSAGMISLPPYSFAAGTSGTGMYLNANSQQQAEAAAAAAKEAATQKQIQDLQAQNQKLQMQAAAMGVKSNSGTITMIGGVGLGICAVGMAACSASGGTCFKYFMWGAIASGGVLLGGMLSKAKADRAVADVSTGPNPHGGMSDAQLQAAVTKEFQNTPEYKQALAALAKTKDGTKVDLTKGTITMPDGKKITTKDLSSPAAMRAAGMSQADIDGFAQTMAEVDKKAKEKIAAADKESSYADGGGGSGGKGSSASGANGEIGLAVPAPGELTLAGLDRDPASQVAGLSTTFQGESIGVAQDDIFGIQTRRYKLEDAKGKFLEK